MSSLLIRRIGQLCTCDPDRAPAPGLVRDAALVARDGIIVYAGPESGLDTELTADLTQEIDAAGCAVIPGFVDAHTHLAWLGERSEEYALRAEGVPYEEIAARGGGIRATVRATSAGSLEELVAATAGRAGRMLQLGTTTVEIKSGYGLQHDAEMRQLDAAAALRGRPGLPDVVTTYLPLHATPEGDRAAYIDMVRTRGVHEAAQRAAFVDVFCEQGAFTVAECERVLVAAREAGMRCKVHAEQRSHSGGARLAARIGAVSADHLEHADAGDCAALAAAGVTAVLLPGASLVLGGPPSPGGALIDAGARIAIATDCNPGTCYSESMPLMLSLAVATAGLTPAQALEAATAGGAAALGLRDRGILRPGMRCDVAILDTDRWLDVAYHLGAQVVRSTVVADRGTLA